MTQLFPEGRDYRTDTYKLTADQVARIQELAGQTLTPDEAREFSIYEITDRKRVIGRVLALSGAGEYGAIETVVGIGLDRHIRGVYLQRIRERQRDVLRSDTFLHQFQGYPIDAPLRVELPLGAEKPAQVVVDLVRKMVAFDRVLAPSPSS